MKLTVMEKRATAACGKIKDYGSYDFQVIWKKSCTWGWCPSIYYRGKKAAYASGCGYDKLSAVLCDFLAPLIPEDSDFRGLGSGAGLSTVQSRLDELGWTLEHVYDGRNEDGFRITRKVAND